MTKDLRKTLQGILEREIELIPEYMDVLDLRDRMAVLVKLIPYILPRATTDPVSEDQEANKQGWVIEVMVPVDKDGNRLDSTTNPT